MIKNKKIIYTDLMLFENFKLLMIEKYEKNLEPLSDSWKLLTKEVILQELINHLFKYINSLNTNDYIKKNDNLVDISNYCLFLVYKNLDIIKIK